MKNHAGKILTGILMAVVITLMMPMASFAASRVTLDVKTDVSGKVNTSLTEKRVLGDNYMTYAIPSDWKKVEKALNGIEYGYEYALNEIPGQKKNDVEKLFVFYFSNERYLDNLQDADDREGIEKAIVLNILPEEHMIGINVAGLTFPTKRINPKGWELFTPNQSYDYYDTRYKDKNGVVHNAEFVFYPNGKKGMCCALYVYTESVHKDEIIYMLQNIKTSEKN